MLGLPFGVTCELTKMNESVSFIDNRYVILPRAQWKISNVSFSRIFQNFIILKKKLSVQTYVNGRLMNEKSSFLEKKFSLKS